MGRDKLLDTLGCVVSDNLACNNVPLALDDPFVRF
jgi:hypothetical protein